MREYILKATSKNKQLVFKKPEWFEQALKQFDGKEVRVKIKLDVDTRSDRQNRYYWPYRLWFRLTTSHAYLAQNGACANFGA